MTETVRRFQVRLGAALLVFALGVTVGCGKTAAPAAAPAAAAPPALPVSVAAATASEIPDATTYVASIQSRDSMVISPLVPGIITAIPVRSGDQVQAGATLFELDPAVEAAAVKNLQASIVAQQATETYDKQQLDRIHALYEAKIESQQDLQSAQSAYDNVVGQIAAMRAQVQQQQVLLSYYTVKAPRAGIVGDIPVKTGDQVTTSTALTTLDEASGLEVYVQVPIERASSLRVGLPVAVLDAEGKTLAETSIHFVSPQVDNQTQSILVKAEVNSGAERLRAQQFVQARITWGSHAAIEVPVLAVSNIGGRYFVDVAQSAGASAGGGRGGFAVAQVPVTVGAITGNNYEITSGLKAGDLVVVSTTAILAPGMPVIPMPAGGRGPSAGRGAADGGR